MDTNSTDRAELEAEDAIAYEALAEYRAKGHTGLRCPRCGGRFRIIIVGNSGEIRCERDGCYSIDWRGI